MNTKQLIKEYGKPTNIDWERINILALQDKLNHVFCTMLHSDNPTGGDFGESGLHRINVMERYEFPKPLPPNLYIEDVDYRYLEGELSC